MLDIKWIRENSQALDNFLVARNAEPQAKIILSVDQEWRGHIVRLQDARERRNSLSKEIGMAINTGDRQKAEILKLEMADLKGWLVTAEEEARRLVQKLESLLSRLPNIPLEDVPVGKTEKENVEIRRFGVPRQFSFPAREHYELGENLGDMDFETAGAIAGTRFSMLSGYLARLERALGQFMIDLHTEEHGYREISPPLLVRDSAVYGTAQLPKFADDLFQTTDGRWLVPTAEVPLSNIVREKNLDASVLPLRFAALTPCFRSEAGAAGRDTRGMLRQHQFWKVEMVSVTDPDSSVTELERMTNCAEEVLKRLELPFRTIVLCTGDMGFSVRKTYDIEVWLPGQNAYREISSCSVCGDFQARRMNARYRHKGEKELRFVHTLNGSGIAVGRCLVAVLENYQQPDGTIVIPKVLRPYMGGLEMIEKKNPEIS